ncbi:MAG: hypothetical protein COT90_03960 [Candidatus Diapherotrites archaeon CG10_big_fil_rev_8_21_14_0_10_31_34]|nr:MAG: hypothetical protein COT90_03960 [Candidatus Diapherotrites archaeon CG10_big_fil_rev_8_21_14_0_10_31_34]
MRIVWSRHARERFFERSLIYGIHLGEADQNILKQKVKEKQKDGTIKTIFKALDYFFTVIKEETKKQINVVSIWESNEREVGLWKKKK